MHHKHFLFKGTEQKDDNTKVEKEIDYQAQIIVYGSLAPEFVKKYVPDFNVDGAKYYAFKISKTGSLNIDASIEIVSEIDYQEDRHKSKKKPPESIYKHKDEIKSKSNSSSLDVTSYQQCQPDFQSDCRTWVVILGGNVQELDTLMSDAKELMKSDVHYIIRDFVNHSLSIPSNASSVYTAMIDKDDKNLIIEDIVKMLNKELKSEFAKYLEECKKHVSEELIANAKKAIEAEVHKKADDYFNTPRRCAIQ